MLTEYEIARHHADGASTAGRTAARFIRAARACATTAGLLATVACVLGWWRWYAPLPRVDVLVTGYAALLFALGWLAVLWAARGWVRGGSQPRDAVPGDAVPGGGQDPDVLARAEGLVPSGAGCDWWNAPARFAGWTLVYFAAAAVFLAPAHRATPGAGTWSLPTQGDPAFMLVMATGVLLLIGLLIGLATTNVPLRRAVDQAWSPRVASWRLAALATPFLLVTPTLAGWVTPVTVLMGLAGWIWLLAVPLCQQARHMPHIPDSD